MYNTVTMQATTVTQKGQVAIPKAIRLKLNIKPNDKLYFSIEGDRLVADPVPTISDMQGFAAKKAVHTTKEQQKAIIKERVLRKHAQEENNN